jgi:tetratricopeptide (TPR) repeat protein
VTISPNSRTTTNRGVRQRQEAPGTKRRCFQARVWPIAASVGLLWAGPYAFGVDTHNLQSRVAEANALDQEGRFDQAIRRYRELLRQYPTSPEVRLRLGNDLARTAKCEDPAEPETSATGPAGIAQQVVIGICHFRRNEMPAAVAHLRSAVALAPDDKQAAIFMGRAAAESGNPAEGLRVLKVLKDGGQNDPDVLYWTGVFYDQLAQQTYDAMAKSHPDSYQLLETQGDQFLQQQKYDDALKAYQKALSTAPDSAGLHFDVGDTYWHMGRLEEAAPELLADLKLNPNHAQANYELGDIAVKRGDSDRGTALLRKALEFDPGLVEAHRSLGRAYLAKQEFADALREFSVVAKAEPSDHTIHALLASVDQRMGRKQEAEAETRKYNELVKQQMSDLQRKEAEESRDAQTQSPVPRE